MISRGWIKKTSGVAIVAFAASIMPANIFSQENPVPEIILIDLTEERESSSKIYEMIKQEVGKSVDYKLKEIDLIIDAGSIEGHLNAISEGKRLFEEGYQRFLSAEYVSAAESFEKAVKLFENSYAYLTSPADLLNAMLFSGSAYFLTGKEELAEEKFISAMLFKPDVELSESYANDDLMIFFKGIKDRLARLPKGSIYINTFPEGASIEINGIFRGTTPLPVEGLKVGEHFLSAKLDGYSRFSKKVKVNDKFEEKYDFPLSEARKKRIFEDIVTKLRIDAVSEKSDWTQSLTELKGMFFADYALLMDCRCKKTPPTLKLYLTNLFTKKLISSIKYPEEADQPEIDNTVVASLVEEIFGAEEKRIRKLTEIAESSAGKPQKKSILSQWWFWTLVGGAVLGGVSATLLLKKGDELRGIKHDGSGAVIIRF